MTIASFKISIRPDQLGPNLISTINDIIEHTYVGKCHPTYGYVNSIKNTKISENHGIEDRTCNNIFSVNCDIDCILPTIGMILIGCEIIMQHESGVFLSYNNLRILVPLSKLNDYEYNRLENVFICKFSDDVLYTGDKCDIEIIDVKYSNGMFNCIGMLN